MGIRIFLAGGSVVSPDQYTQVSLCLYQYYHLLDIIASGSI